jgi:hypothetical protein
MMHDDEEDNKTVVISHDAMDKIDMDKNPLHQQA